jgi:hypothetical protein
MSNAVHHQHCSGSHLCDHQLLHRSACDATLPRPLHHVRLPGLPSISPSLLSFVIYALHVCFACFFLHLFPACDARRCTMKPGTATDWGFMVSGPQGTDVAWGRLERTIISADLRIENSLSLFKLLVVRV